MAKKSSGRPTKSTRAPEQKIPSCLAVAGNGVSTSRDFARFMSAMMVDVIESRVAPGIANAACNAGGKLLKVVEMQMKYGTAGDGGRKDLVLAPAHGDDGQPFAPKSVK